MSWENEINKIKTAEGTEEDTEEVPEATRGQGNDNNWLFYFLTTNVNKASNIRRYEIEEEY